MIRRLFVVLCGLATLLAAPASAPAADDPGFAFYEHQAKDVLKSAGDKIWEAADDAKRQGFFHCTEEQAERALEFDPEQKDAREYLKYSKKEGKWVQDAEEFSKMQHQNVKNSNESQDGFDKRMRKWEEETLPKANKYVAGKYAELGDICAAKGHPEQAVKGYEASLRLDRDNEKARKGLGYTKFGKTWLTKKQDDARKAASKSVKVEEKEPTQFEDLFKIKLNKIESAHVRIESPFPIEELQEHCKAAETAYAYYLADFGRSPEEDVFSGRKSLFLIMDTEPQWDLFVDRYGGSEKDFVRQLSSCGIGELGRGIRGGKPTVDTKKKDGGVDRSLGSSPETRRDTIVHGIVHQLNRLVWRLDEHTWLDEGLAYYYTLKVLETCLTHCMDIKRGDYANGHLDEGGIKKWNDPANWKPLLKGLVKKKDDTPLRSIMKLPLTKLDYIDTVKAWGVASWLMDLDRDKFTSVLDQMLDRAVKQENVFQGSYGKGIEDIDEDWHRYALKCY